MFHGIAPSLLLSQVRNTASWAVDGTPTHDWQRLILAAPELEREERWLAREGRYDYLALCLAAHYTTVATFVPTDVDTQIRHHLWRPLGGEEGLRPAVERVDAAASWDPRLVSERVLASPAVGDVSGHAGEWLAVRAAALDRALATGARALADELAEKIDAELSREANAYLAAEREPGQEILALQLATTASHNVGDLSRVVEQWPCKTSEATALRARFARLGHEGPERYGGAFARAGHVNKQVMAAENHRFLSLRKARALRTSRALLLPLGPTFDAWGERVGSHKAFGPGERAEVLAALLEGHESDPAQQGYLRAIAGIHRTHPGGVDALARDVPARLRKLVSGGPVRDALRVDRARFEARLINRFRAAVAELRG